MLAITHYDPNTLYILRFSGEVDIRIRSSHFKGIIKNKYFSAGESSCVVYDGEFHSPGRKGIECL